MLPHILWFAFGLVLLIKGGDWFVDGAADLARRFRVPDILIGATVVSIGTTLPEVMVSATSAAQGQGAMAYGNAVGSVICNTALISALTVAIRPSSVDRKSLLTPVAFFFGAAAIYSAVAYTGGNFTRPVGLVLLALFVIYMVVAVRQAPAKRRHLDGGEKASRRRGVGNATAEFGKRKIQKAGRPFPKPVAEVIHLLVVDRKDGACVGQERSEQEHVEETQPVE